MLPGRPKWFLEALTPDLLHGASISRVLFSGRTRYQQVEVLETPAFGRMLVLDGKTQSAEGEEFVYHEALVHPALVAHPRPQWVFIGGGGEGSTAREVLRHATVQQVVMVDVDEEVVHLCRQHLPQHHQGAFDDPRLRLHFADALAFLEQSPACYDVIILDLPDPIEGGTAYLLYTQEFYRLVRSRLNPGGILVTQAGPASIVNYTEVFTAIHRTLSTVFPLTVPYIVPMQSFGEAWGFVLASTGPDPRALTPLAVDTTLAQREVQGLRFYDGTIHPALFALPKYLRQALAEEQRIITKDKPLFVF
ncbi:MAG: polyamine aminopropyltransferase [Dehalococcoidia bacterium]|nr:polyamine aminopropyltransferase [Dehalococcoidia bacterium]MDW8119585.1 polyamine aminopropyltransferase [Chloroflexota bacterium]